MLHALREQPRPVQVGGDVERATPDVPENASGALIISPPDNIIRSRPSPCVMRHSVMRPGFSGNSDSSGSLRLEWIVARGATSGSAISIGAWPQCQNTTVSETGSTSTRSVLNTPRPEADCSTSEEITPKTSASQPPGRPSSFRSAIAPQAAQPYSVKNSGQQRTATPANPSVSARSLSAA